MSSLKVVLGYVTGAPIQAVLLYLVSLVLGTYFAARYASSLGAGTIVLQATLSGWYFAQGCLLVLATMIASLVLLTALATGGKGNFIGVLILIGIFGGWVAIVFVPGLALLMGVMSGGVLIGLITKSTVGGDPLIIVTAAVLHFVYALILLSAACAKLRAPARPLFGIELGLILLVVWNFTLVTGYRVAPDYDWLFSEWDAYGYAQLVASTIAFMLVALFPLIAAATERFHHDRAACFGEQDTTRRCRELTLISLVLALMAAVTCLYVMGGANLAQESLAAHTAFEIAAVWIPIVAALLLSFWIIFNWIYFLVAHGRRILIGLPIMLVLLMGIPIGLDALIGAIVRQTLELYWSLDGYLTGLSPIGTLMLAPDGGAAVWTGLGFQVVIAGILTILARGIRRRLRHEADESVPELTSAPAS